MEDRTKAKRIADNIVLECESDPKKLEEWMNEHWSDIGIDMKNELYMRLCTLSGYFV